MRFSSTSLIATVAAATLLVVGLDYATYAATGDSLVLGRINQANSTTVVKRTDHGPALRLLTTSLSDAPLSTNGRGRVQHLNADRVDGKHASDLTTHAITYRAGRRGQTISPAGLWATPVKPGIYEMSFDAMLWDQSAPNPPVNFICGALDLTTFGTQNQKIYAASSAAYYGGAPAAVSGAATVRIRDGMKPGAVCFPESGTFQFFKPLAVTYAKITSRENRTAKPRTPPAARRGFGGFDFGG